MEAALEQAEDDSPSSIEQLDRALQDVAAVTVGRRFIEGELDKVHDLWPSEASAQTRTGLSELYGRLNPGDDPFFAEQGLDPTDGRSFRPDISDGTNNQIFHTGFFQYIAYAVDGSVFADAGNLAHETIIGTRSPSANESQMSRANRTDQGLADVVRILPDGGINWAGQTREDFQASLDGADLGMTLRRVRDSPHLDRYMDDIPELIRTAYSGQDTRNPDLQRMMDVFELHRLLSAGDTQPMRPFAEAREALDGEAGRAVHDTGGEGDGDLAFARMIADHYTAEVDAGRTRHLMPRLDRTLEESGMPGPVQQAVRRRIERLLDGS